MDETKRRRLSLIWIVFALLMAIYVLQDGFETSTGDLLGLFTVAFGIGLAALYYLNPGDVLSFK
ncbi:hypothetical protein SAMN05421858_2670 [Haladaptatus litoreus]|uniref:Uncharacterized protein n=1 Tax=Haladaptatus litoreus TaxID=553468 RepID=A0A1N7BP32_9EURY|nr:hypothetical protein [Haladaptatus litoreus]SIR53090.1 hypothetical protein SAMN05421858_2670 [Haladaptatus litoreus]